MSRVFYVGDRLMVRWVSPSTFREEALEDESFGRWIFSFWTTERHKWLYLFGLEFSLTKKKFLPPG